MNKTHRFIALLLGIVFVLFCLVQYNDPDTLVWIVLYGFAAGLSYAVYFRKLYPKITLIAFLGYLTGAFYKWPATYEGITLSMDYKVEIEEARESLGLLICALVMGYYLYLARREKYRASVMVE